MYDSVHAALAANMGHSVTDSVTEKGEKIVVTTTISLDKAALHSDITQNAASLLSQALAGGLNQPDSAASLVARAVAENRIQIVPIGPKLFLGLVNGRSQARPLCIDDTLFIFVPRSNSLTGMAELVAQLLQRLPPGSPWSVPTVTEFPESVVRQSAAIAADSKSNVTWNAEQIAQALNGQVAL